MKPDASKIIASLPTLSRADLSAVRGAADSLLGPQATPLEQPATPLYAAITRALSLKLGWGAFTHTSSYKQYKRGSEAITSFMAESFPALDQRLQTALHGLMIDCLVDDLRQRRIPLSMGTVCSNLERTPQVFRDAFPGYLESGHGQFIIERLGGR